MKKLRDYKEKNYKSASEFYFDNCQEIILENLRRM